VFVTSVLTLVLPFCAQWLWLLYLVRAIMGLGEAVTFPAMNEMFTHWIPAPERSASVTFANAGSSIGTALALPISGIFIGMGKDAYGVSCTWPDVFYFFGAVGCIWYMVWVFCIASTPSQHRTISAEEKAYLEGTTHIDANVVGTIVIVQKSPTPPWKGFVTQPAALALFANHFAFNYGCYMMMTYMPKFLDEQLGMNMKDAGFAAVFPYLLMGLMGIFSGLVADRLTLHCHIRTIRLGFLCVGYIGSGAFLVLLSYVTHNRLLAEVVMNVSIGFSGLISTGFGPNFLDISPHYAGQLYGVSNTIGNIAGILAPMVTAYILDNKTGAAAVVRWRLAFCTSAAIYAVAGVLALAFLRGKPIQAVN